MLLNAVALSQSRSWRSFLGKMAFLFYTEIEKIPFFPFKNYEEPDVVNAWLVFSINVVI